MLLNLGFCFNTARAIDLDIKVDTKGVASPTNNSTSDSKKGTFGYILSNKGGLNVNTNAQTLLNTILQVIVGFAGVVSLGFVIYGGITIMFSAKGDKALYAKSAKIMITGGIAFLIVVLSYVITNFIMGYITFISR